MHTTSFLICATQACQTETPAVVRSNLLNKIDSRFEEIRNHLLCWKSTVRQEGRLSNITINHWNVTIQSIIETIRFLFEEGWSFVQTRRFNQDNLEVEPEFFVNYYAI